MKPLLLTLSFFLTLTISAQSLDHISVRKKNGRVVKNFYAGSDILLQTAGGRYFEGPIQAIRNDSVFVTLYDIRLYRTVYGSVIKDTVDVSLLSLATRDIQRVHLAQKQGFFQRRTGTLLSIGGAGYFTLNLMNGEFFDKSVSTQRKLKVLGISAGAFGLGYLFNKLFSSDGFSKKKHSIIYVDL